GNNDGYDSSTTGNINGVYRFPARNSTGSNSLASGGGINTYGVTFDVPNLNINLDNGTRISDLAIGIVFLRGTRVKDCLLQGVALSCYPFHGSEPNDASPSDDFIWNGPAREDFVKVIPLIKGVLPVSEYLGKDELGECGPYPKG